MGTGFQPVLTRHPCPSLHRAQPTGSATCKRGFCQFIYEPIKTVIEAAMNDNKDKLFALLDKLEVRPGYRCPFGWGEPGLAV